MHKTVSLIAIDRARPKNCASDSGIGFMKSACIYRGQHSLFEFAIARQGRRKFEFEELSIPTKHEGELGVWRLILWK